MILDLKTQQNITNIENFEQKKQLYQTKIKDAIIQIISDISDDHQNLIGIKIQLKEKFTIKGEFYQEFFEQAFSKQKKAYNYYKDITNLPGLRGTEYENIIKKCVEKWLNNGIIDWRMVYFEYLRQKEAYEQYKDQVNKDGFGGSQQQNLLNDLIKQYTQNGFVDRFMVIFMFKGGFK